MSDVKTVLESIGYVLSDVGKEYRTAPIYRDSSNSTVLSISKSTGEWYDFSERNGGSLEKLVQITLGLPTIDSAKEVLSKNNFVKSAAELREPELESVAVFDKALLLKLHREHSYWLGKKISQETIDTFEGGIAYNGRMANRYVFPIFDSRQNVIGFSGRDLLKLPTTLRPKWKILGKKTNFLYPYHKNQLFLKEKKEVVLVESIGDMLNLWENGVKNCLVTFGIDISPKLVSLLISLFFDRIIIAFNNDAENGGAGNLAAKKEEKRLLEFFDKQQLSIALPTKKDFGEMNSSEISAWKSANLTR